MSGKLKALLTLLGRPRYALSLLGIWFLVLGVFLWINRLNLLAYIWSRPDLSLLDKVMFITGVYKNLLINLDSPLAISILVLAFLAAVNALLLILLLRSGNRTQHTGRTSMGVVAAAASSHVLSCGGTLLLAPIFPALAGAGVTLGSGAIVSQALGVAANIAGSLIVIWSIRRALRHMVLVGYF